MENKEKGIVDDLIRVAESLGLKRGERFSRDEYLIHGAKFSKDNIYDGGTDWTYYCKKAGFLTKAKEEVPDAVYYDRLEKAYELLGRLPKTSERKKFGLNFHKRRWATLELFIKEAISIGIIPGLMKKGKRDIPPPVERKPKSQESQQTKNRLPRPIPAIPKISIKKKWPYHWDNLGITGHPYAPQSEADVIALFSILCAEGKIRMQILGLNNSKGIDGICYDEDKKREVRVEFKRNLTRGSWSHPFDSFDYLACWENRWTGEPFPKPVIELKSLIKS